MRSASLFAVAALVFVLAVSSLSPVAALGGITVVKVTTNGDTTTEFLFKVSGPNNYDDSFYLSDSESWSELQVGAGEWTVVEDVPPGWVLTVDCGGLFNLPPDVSTFEYVPGGVIITYYPEDTVGCKFINSPAPAVGGSVVPVNTLALVAPWLAVIGLVGCITTIAVIAKKHRP